jgi:hypothetical protein
MISQAVNGHNISVLRADVFIAVFSGLAGRRIELLGDV